EWELFRDVSLPEGKVLVPGVIDVKNSYVEHPDLVALRLRQFASVVGRERLIAGTDCGLQTFRDMSLVDPQIAWAKPEALTEGARRASRQLWPGHSARSLPAAGVSR